MTNHTTNENQLLNSRELAGVLGLAPDTVRRAAKAGAIPFVRIGGAVRFNADHVATITRDGFTWPDKAAKSGNACRNGCTGLKRDGDNASTPKRENRTKPNPRKL